MHLAHYLHLLHVGQQALADAFRAVGRAHGDEPDVQAECRMFAEQATRDAQRLEPFARQYGEQASDAPERLHSELFHGTHDGPVGLLRDLHDLYLMATECDLCWTMVGQAAQGLRDEGLVDVVTDGDGNAQRQLAWLRTRMKQSAPQALVVAD